MCLLKKEDGEVELITRREFRCRLLVAPVLRVISFHTILRQYPQQGARSASIKPAAPDGVSTAHILDSGKAITTASLSPDLSVKGIHTHAYLLPFLFNSIFLTVLPIFLQYSNSSIVPYIIDLVLFN